MKEKINEWCYSDLMNTTKKTILEYKIIKRRF